MTDANIDTIAEIMDTFDFEKVQKVMSFLNWRWAGADAGVPSIVQIRSTAHNLLTSCLEAFEQAGRPPEGMVYSTGGLTARIEVYEDGLTELSLLFYVDCIERQL